MTFAEIIPGLLVGEKFRRAWWPKKRNGSYIYLDLAPKYPDCRILKYVASDGRNGGASHTSESELRAGDWVLVDESPPVGNPAMKDEGTEEEGTKGMAKS